MMLKYILLASSFCLFWSISQSLILSPVVSFVSDFIAFVNLLCLLLFISLFIRKATVSRLFLFLVALSFIPVIQWFFGVIFFKGDAFLAFAYLVATALAVFCGDNLSVNYRNKSLYFFALTFLCIGVINVFFAWTQMLSLEYLGSWIRNSTSSRAYGNIGQPNLFASVLMMSLLSVLYLFESRQCRRGLFWLMSLLILSGMVLAQSRTTIVVGLAVAVWYTLSCKQMSFRVKWFDIILLMIAYWLLQWGIGELLVSQGGALREISSTDNARWSLWQGMWQAVVDGPLWGYGWTQAGVAQVLVDAPFDSIAYSEHSHNLFLDLLVWNGPILGAGVISAIIFVACQRVKICKSIEQWIMLAIIGAIFIHSMLEYPIEYAFFLLPVGFLLGLGRDTSQREITLRLSKWFTLPLLSLFVVILVVVGRDYQTITDEYKQAVFENMGMRGVDVPENKIPQVVLLDQWAGLVGAMRVDPDELKTPEQIEWARQVSHRFAYISTLYFYIKVALATNNQQEVDRMLKVVDKIYGERGILLIKEGLTKQSDVSAILKKASLQSF